MTKYIEKYEDGYFVTITNEMNEVVKGYFTMNKETSDVLL